MARIVYIVNKDKTLSLLTANGDLQFDAVVTLSWPNGFQSQPLVSAAGGKPWALDEQADTIKAISNVLYEMEEGGLKRSPTAVVTAIEAAKGTQGVYDGKKVRSVKTMQDGVTEYQAKGLDLTVDVKTVALMVEDGEEKNDPEAEMRDVAQTALKRLVAKKMVDEDAGSIEFDKMTAWMKAKCPVIKSSDGKKPTYLTVAEVFK